MTIQARRTPHLFEIWCFVEFANAMIELGHPAVVQRSLLRTRSPDPLFAIGSGFQAYYNFFGDSVSMSHRPKIFKKTNVEWFIENQKEPRKSIVMDTKYRDWCSSENLKVLGYMNDFDVDQGALIYSSDLPPDEVEFDQSQDGFLVRVFGSLKERRFYILTLKPRESEMIRNKRVLRQFITEYLGVCSGSG